LRRLGKAIATAESIVPTQSIRVPPSRAKGSPRATWRWLPMFLRCVGYDLVGLRAEGRRKVFVFRDRPDPPRRRAGVLWPGRGGGKALRHNA
jgi:hypothetical protein